MENTNSLLNQTDNSETVQLKRLYSRNRNVYNLFINRVTNEGRVFFRSQNSLYCYIEDLKNPDNQNRRRGSKPYYDGEKNYGPIVAHLIADGIIERGSNINNRYTFIVLEKSLKKQPTAILKREPAKSIPTSENYNKNVYKTNISNLAGEESKIKPNMENQGKPKQNNIATMMLLAEAEIHLSNAIHSLQSCIIEDSFMNARLYNIQALTQDVRAAIIDKKEFLINL